MRTATAAALRISRSGTSPDCDTCVREESGESPKDPRASTRSGQRMQPTGSAGGCRFHVLHQADEGEGPAERLPLTAVDHVQPAALPPGSRIAEYEIVRVLGAGGFGITYLAYDHQLDGPVALKEYFPADVAARTDGSEVAATATTNQDLFAWGLDRFIQEARAIHRLRHPNVVRAYRYLEANGTAYIVLEYVEGEPLKTILDRRGRLSANEWRPWMNALLDGLAHVHAHGYLHRDIKPANIVVRSDNGEPVLIDFGSARLQHGDRTLTQVLTAGYAPIEQYSNDAAQGPQGDIYAMAAVSYRVLTGNAVPSAPDRMLNDGYEPLADRSAGADSRWLAAIDRGLAIRPEDRPQSADAWRAELGNDDATSSAAIQPQPAEADAKTATRPPDEALGETGKSATTTNRSAPEKASSSTKPSKSVGNTRSKVRQPQEEKERSFPLLWAHSLWAVPTLVIAVALQGSLADQGAPEDTGAARQFRTAAEQGDAQFRTAAELGDAYAQLSLGLSYYEGEGVPQDYEQAAHWLRMAAEQGDVDAQYFLATLYYAGDGVRRDHAEAARWLRMAAEQGDAGAQYFLATLYYAGDGVRRDHAEAARWLRMAAEQGDAGAQYFLATLYYAGDGVPRSQAHSLAWFSVAYTMAKAAPEEALAEPVSFYKDATERSYSRATPLEAQQAQKLELEILERIAAARRK